MPSNDPRDREKTRRTKQATFGQCLLNHKFVKFPEWVMNVHNENVKKVTNLFGGFASLDSQLNPLPTLGLIFIFELRFVFVRSTPLFFRPLFLLFFFFFCFVCSLHRFDSLISWYRVILYMLTYDFKSIIPGHETKNQWMLRIMNGAHVNRRMMIIILRLNTAGDKWYSISIPWELYYIQFEFDFELFHFIIFIIDLLI